MDTRIGEIEIGHKVNEAYKMIKKSVDFRVEKKGHVSHEA